MENHKFVHVFVGNGRGIFLQHRDNIPGIYDPNMLSAFGGHVESDDRSLHEAATRELSEETQLKDNRLKLHGITRRTSVDLGGHAIRKIVYGYSVTVPGLDSLDCFEGQGALFIPYGSNIDQLNYDVTDITRSEIMRFFSAHYSIDKA